MNAPSIHTDLLAYNFNLGTTNYIRHINRQPEPEKHPFSPVGKSFMHELARDGDVLSAEVVADKGAEIDLPDDEGRRPLHEAAFFGHAGMVRFLVASGARVDAPVHPFGHTALWFAAAQGHYGIADWLIARGAGVHVTDALTGQGLLHLAAQRGDLRMTGMLIAAGIDVCAEDRRGMTARDYAARGNHALLESALLKVMEHHARYGAVAA